MIGQYRRSLCGWITRPMFVEAGISASTANLGSKHGYMKIINSLPLFQDICPPRTNPKPQFQTQTRRMDTAGEGSFQGTLEEYSARWRPKRLEHQAACQSHEQGSCKTMPDTPPLQQEMSPTFPSSVSCFGCPLAKVPATTDRNRQSSTRRAPTADQTHPADWIRGNRMKGSTGR